MAPLSHVWPAGGFLVLTVIDKAPKAFKPVELAVHTHIDTHTANHATLEPACSGWA